MGNGFEQYCSRIRHVHTQAHIQATINPMLFVFKSLLCAFFNHLCRSCCCPKIVSNQAFCSPCQHFGEKNSSDVCCDRHISNTANEIGRASCRERVCQYV